MFNFSLLLLLFCSLTASVSAFASSQVSWLVLVLFSVPEKSVYLAIEHRAASTISRVMATLTLVTPFTLIYNMILDESYTGFPHNWFHEIP